MEKYSNKRLPRILRINRIETEKLWLSVLFSNGENRILDFKRILTKEWKVKRSDPAYRLYNREVFTDVHVDEGYGLTWNSIQVPWLDFSTGKDTTAAFDLSGDTLYILSEPDPEMHFSVGELVRKARLAANLSQEDVAKRAGTSRTYITKLENDKQDIELMTLKKIVEAGLNKRLRISIA